MAYFQYPEAARVHSQLTKEQLLKYLTLTPALKRDFTDEIQSITWRYKLAPSTIHLSASESFPEFQVFEIKLKGEYLNPDLLRAIDAAIPQPIIFEIYTPTALYVTATHKRRHATQEKMVLNPTYFQSPYYALTQAREPLPTAISLEYLYEAILKSLMPAESLPDEAVPIETLLAQAETRRKLTAEIDKLTRKIRNEKQFKKQVALNQELAALKATLNTLK